MFFLLFFLFFYVVLRVRVSFLGLFIKGYLTWLDKLTQLHDALLVTRHHHKVDWLQFAD